MKIRIHERPLGPLIAGLCYYRRGLIEICPNQGQKEWLDTMIHELLHKTFNVKSERRVYRSAHIISEILWRVGYRRPKTKKRVKIKARFNRYGYLKQ